MQVGDIFLYRTGMSIHTDLDGMVGLVLALPNGGGQYKVQVGHKTLWLMRGMMEDIWI